MPAFSATLSHILSRDIYRIPLLHLYTTGTMTFPDFYGKVGAVKRTGHGMSGKENDDYSYVYVIS